MIQTKRRMVICWSLLCVNILFIWGNSILPGSVSGQISRLIKDVIAALFPGMLPEAEGGHGLLRKLAHFTEFACLGACLAWLFGMVKKNILLALGCGIAVACIDETIQCFVPDRGPAVLDVLIDTAGVSMGMILLLMGYYFIKRSRNQK